MTSRPRNRQEQLEFYAKNAEMSSYSYEHLKSTFSLRSDEAEFWIMKACRPLWDPFKDMPDTVLMQKPIAKFPWLYSINELMNMHFALDRSTLKGYRDAHEFMQRAYNRSQLAPLYIADRRSLRHSRNSDTVIEIDQDETEHNAQGDDDAPIITFEKIIHRYDNHSNNSDEEEQTSSERTFSTRTDKEEKKYLRNEKKRLKLLRNIEKLKYERQSKELDFQRRIMDIDARTQE